MTDFPIQVNIRSFSLSTGSLDAFGNPLPDANILGHLRSISIYESIYKPYHTAKLVVEDHNNIIENMNLRGGEACSVAWDCDEPKIYETTLYVFSVHGQQTSRNPRCVTYNIELIGAEYFSDAKNLVQNSYKNIPATSAISAIFNQYIGGSLEIKQPSNGPISKEGYIKSAIKPFKAIDDIKKHCNFGGSGNCLFFKDAKHHVLSPLEVLFATMGIQETFNQIHTLGSQWPLDILRERNVIIVAEANVDDKGRASTDSVARAQGAGQSLFDMRTKNRAIDKIQAKSMGSILGSIPGIGGKLGGVANYGVMDGAHQPTSVDPNQKSPQEHFSAALFQNGPGMRVKVPIQSGMYVTVGKGIYLNLLPPMGDIDGYGRSDMSGEYLVTEVCHELQLVNKTVQATSTFNCNKKG
jgi:hypothetical protein